MKPVKQKLSDEKIKAILGAERTSALGTSASSDLSQQRIKALDYYMGDMADDMPAPDGQSSAVSTDVQDVIEGVLPIVLDGLVSTEKVVEFKPISQADIPAARQETDFVNHVFFQENDGFLTLYTAVKDALLSKNTFVKWFVEEEEERTREQYKGLSEDAFGIIAADTTVKIIDQEQYPCPDPLTGAPTTCYNVIVEAVKTKLRRRVVALPPEEVLISKNARTIQSSPYLAHVVRKPQADVIAQFPDKAEIIKGAPSAVTSSDNTEAFNRQSVQDNQDQTQSADDVNREMREIEVVEHYIRLALEEDDVARRYKITTVGSAYDILDTEEVSEWPIATASPIINTHRVFGRSLADLVLDIQQIKTALLRALLNNAYFGNNQRIEVSETHASENTIDDLLNNRVGGIVRTKMPGGLKPLEPQPIGNWVVPVIEYMDGVRSNRTGSNEHNMSIDVDQLNHARTGAVERLMSAADMRIKLIMRIFAETLLVDMFRGIHHMCQEYSEQAEEVELSGQWVTVDPREWKKRKHMTVDLPLGGASKQQLLGFFGNLLTVQKEVLTLQGGPNGPLVSLQNVRATVEQMTRLAGLKSVDPYMMQPPPPNPNAPPPPNPKMVEAQANAAATAQDQQADQQLQQQKLQFEQWLETTKAAAARQREQDEFAHKVTMERMRFEHDKEMAQLQAGFKARLDGEKTMRGEDRKDRQAEAASAREGAEA